MTVPAWRPLAAADVLLAWDRAHSARPVERALSIAGVSGGEAARAAMARFSAGERNAALLSLRAATFGDLLDAYVECPHCGAALELSLETSRLLADVHRPTGASATQPLELRTDRVAIEFRLPTADDLFAVGRLGAVDARRELAERCVLSAHDAAGVPLSAGAIADADVDALAERMSECDPDAEMRFAVECTACGHGWSADFDPETFFATELDACARRLLRDVHALARGYGWRESDILAMSAVRRQAYLEMLER
jgi:hypothetical protein